MTEISLFFSETSFNLNPIGNPTVPTAHVRTSAVPSITLIKRETYPAATNFSGNVIVILRKYLFYIKIHYYDISSIWSVTFILLLNFAVIDFHEWHEMYRRCWYFNMILYNKQHILLLDLLSYVYNYVDKQTWDFCWHVNSWFWYQLRTSLAIYAYRGALNFVDWWYLWKPRKLVLKT